MFENTVNFGFVLLGFFFLGGGGVLFLTMYNLYAE